MSPRQGSNEAGGNCRSEIAADRSAGLGHAVVGSEIHLLVFDAAPQSLNEDVVVPRALPVHADRDAILDQHANERHARELRALAYVEDFWLAVLLELAPPAFSAAGNANMQLPRLVELRMRRTIRINQPTIATSFSSANK